MLAELVGFLGVHGVKTTILADGFSAGSFTFLTCLPCLATPFQGLNNILALVGLNCSMLNEMWEVKDISLQVMVCDERKRMNFLYEFSVCVHSGINKNSFDYYKGMN